MKFKPAIAWVLFVSACGFFSNFTVAEEADGEAMEEVIVTATYRDTRLMDTPITISAVTEAQIELKGIEDIQTLYQSIPGLSYRTIRRPTILCQ